MTTTLKLDWSPGRIEAVRATLQGWLDDHAGIFAGDSHDARWTEIWHAVQDINRYRGAVAEVKASLTTETTGYCAGCGEFIEYDAALKAWAANSRLQPLRCPAYTDHRHVKYTTGQEEKA